MIMILTLLPAESDAAKKLADLTADGNVLAVAASKISDFGSDSGRVGFVECRPINAGCLSESFG